MITSYYDWTGDIKESVQSSGSGGDGGLLRRRLPQVEERFKYVCVQGCPLIDSCSS